MVTHGCTLNEDSGPDKESGCIPGCIAPVISVAISVAIEPLRREIDKEIRIISIWIVSVAIAVSIIPLCLIVWECINRIDVSVCICIEVVVDEGVGIAVIANSITVRIYRFICVVGEYIGIVSYAIAVSIEAFIGIFRECITVVTDSITIGVQGFTSVIWECITVVTDSITIAVECFTSVIWECITVVANSVAVCIKCLIGIVWKGICRITVPVAVPIGTTDFANGGCSCRRWAVIVGVGHTVAVKVVLVNEFERRRHRVFIPVLIEQRECYHTRGGDRRRRDLDGFVVHHFACNRTELAELNRDLVGDGDTG